MKNPFYDVIGKHRIPFFDCNAYWRRCLRRWWMMLNGIECEGGFFPMEQ